MNASRSDLKKQLDGDRERYVALLNQTIGGLLVLEHLDKLDAERESELSQADLEKMLGGKIEAIEPIGGEDGIDQNKA